MSGQRSMGQRQTPHLWILLVLSIGCGALGIFALRAEAASTALGAGSSGLSQFLLMTSRDMEYPLSLQGRRVLLENCAHALQVSPPLALRFASDQQRQALAIYCARLAEEAVQAARTDGYAWLVLAKAQIRQGELEAASRSILLSARTAPTESWIAQSRFELVQDNYGRLLPEAQAVGDADIILLIPSNRGAVIARRYVLDTAFRQRAERLVEAQTEALQRRFISLVRRQF